MTKTREGAGSSVDGLVALCDRAADAVAIGFDAFAECAADLGEVATSPLLAEIVDREIRAVAASPSHFVAAIRGDSMTLAERRGAAIKFARLPRTSLDPITLLHGCPRHRLVTPLALPAPLVVHRHEEGSPELFDRALRLGPAERKAIALGEVVPLRAFFDVSEWEGADEPGAVLVLEGPPVCFQMWTYDRTTLAPKQTVSAALEYNRIEGALTLLAELGHVAAASTVAGLYDHPAHHIRWSAVRAAMELDEVVGAAVLRRAASDPHPHVARAARRHLRELGLEEE